MLRAGFYMGSGTKDKLQTLHNFAPDQPWRGMMDLVPFALFSHSSLVWEKAGPFKTVPSAFFPSFQVGTQMIKSKKMKYSQTCYSCVILDRRLLTRKNKKEYLLLSLSWTIYSK